MSFLREHKYSIALCAAVVLLLAMMGHCLFAPVNRDGETRYLLVDNDDDIDSVKVKLDARCHRAGVSTLMILSRHLGYAEHIRTGRFAITPDIGALQLLRHLRNGQQEPLALVVSSKRTRENLADDLGRKLMLSKEQLLAYFDSNDSLQRYGVDTATVMALFIPNTYEVYWNITVHNLLVRAKSEYDAFWKGRRSEQAAALGLTPVEVATLASIIDEETANNSEKPMVAGMYYNRLRASMPLQADPTIKFALKRFELRRIYHNMLTVESPYNTYVNTGLPPGPIRMASVAGIDAVLRLVRHDYLYMCAKEDFSGTHNFARTYAEHLKNAARYSKALNERNVK